MRFWIRNAFDYFYYILYNYYKFQAGSLLWEIVCNKSTLILIIYPIPAHYSFRVNVF